MAQQRRRVQDEKETQEKIAARAFAQVFLWMPDGTIISCLYLPVCLSIQLPVCLLG